MWPQRRRMVRPNTGKLNGLDWSSVFAMSMGVQKQMSEKFTVRGGYGYNQLPIKNSESIFNLGSPLLYQDRFTGGASYYLSPSTAISAAYSFYPEVSRTGHLAVPCPGVRCATPGYGEIGRWPINLRFRILRAATIHHSYSSHSSTFAQVDDVFSPCDFSRGVSRVSPQRDLAVTGSESQSRTSAGKATCDVIRQTTDEQTTAEQRTD